MQNLNQIITELPQQDYADAKTQMQRAIVAQVPLSELQFNSPESVTVSGKTVPVSPEVVPDLIAAAGLRENYFAYETEQRLELANVLLKSQTLKPYTLVFSGADGKLLKFNAAESPLISVETGFRFIEKIVEALGLVPEKIDYNPLTHNLNFSFYDTNSDNIVKLDEGEEHFRGVRFSFNEASMVLHPQMLRLVCSNGSLGIKEMSVEQSVLDSYELYGSLEQLANLQQKMSEHTKHFYARARTTPASLAEVLHGVKLLNMVDQISWQESEEIFDLPQMRYDYSLLGVDLEEVPFFELSQYQSSMLVWDLYNRLTEQATHNTLISDTHLYHSLMYGTNKLLTKRRLDLSKIRPSPY